MMRKILLIYFITGAIGLFIGMYSGGRFMENNSKQHTIIVDMNRPFAKMDGDSIWWLQPVSVTDSIVSDSTGGEIQSYRYAHSLKQDTAIGLLHYNPYLIEIYDGRDTTYYHWGDTIRIWPCHPDTVYIQKPVYRNINHVDVLNMN